MFIAGGYGGRLNSERRKVVCKQSLDRGHRASMTAAEDDSVGVHVASGSADERGEVVSIELVVCALY